MAKKNNSHSDQIDLTPFEFIANSDNKQKSACASCHPGGGMLEFDRDGMRYDQRLKKEPYLSRSLDGDYYQSQWDQSGVIEADCFFCHSSGYNKTARNKQLHNLNFKWATVVASGLGQVQGAVKSGQIPKVVYNTRLFNNDGRYAGSIIRRPKSENCLLCHKNIDIKKRKTHWGDKKNIDVHQSAGVLCIDCHFGDLAHNLAKGDENVSSVRNDLDNTMRSCEDCHTQNTLGAPTPTHFGIRGDHLNRIACTTCHITSLARAGAAAIVSTTGEIVLYPEPSAEKFDQLGKWPIRYELDQRRKVDPGKIRPVNYVLSVFYTNKAADGLHYPLFTKEIQAAYVKLKNNLEDKEANSIKLNQHEDIKRMLLGLTETLSKNKRFDAVNPYFHQGELLFYLNDNNELIKEKDITWAGQAEAYNISHNVAPANQALGAKGCVDCHSEISPVFGNTTFVDMFGSSGKPKYKKTLTKYSPAISTSNWIFSLHLNVITPYLFAGLITLIMFLALHISLASSQIPDFLQEPAEFKLYNKDEHRAFLLKMNIFLILVILGHLVYFSKLGMLNVFIALYQKTLVFAGIVGIMTLIASIIAFIIWIRGGYFGPHDKNWINKLRNSLEETHSRSKKKNPIKQKILFWLMNCLAVITGVSGVVMIFKEFFPVSIILIVSSLHASFSMLFIALMILRAYIIGFINPNKTWRELTDAKVRYKWAKKHHSDWHDNMK